MKQAARPARGFTLVEMMVALAIGLILIGAVISVHLAQSQVSKSTTAQASIQNAENAISALVIPTIRAAGFSGCSTLGTASSGGALSNLVAGGPPPLGTLGTTAAMVQGYEFSDNGTLSIPASNPANDAVVGHWAPTLDATLAGAVLPGSDVLVVLGAVPGVQPVGVTAATAATANVAVQDSSAISAAVAASAPFAAISDCLKSTVFRVTAVSAGTVTHAAGAGAMNNATAAFGVNYAPGAMVVPLRQTAFFVAQGTGGADQSWLVRATWQGTNLWAIEPLVPGINAMQVQYGSGTNGLITRYQTASAVTDWTSVYSIRIAFLIEGQLGSSTGGTAASVAVLGTSVTPPSDTRLRHVYELTINLRNAAL